MLTINLPVVVIYFIMLVEFKMLGAGLACSGVGGVGQGIGICNAVDKKQKVKKFLLYFVFLTLICFLYCSTYCAAEIISENDLRSCFETLLFLNYSTLLSFNKDCMSWILSQGISDPKFLAFLDSEVQSYVEVLADMKAYSFDSERLASVLDAYSTSVVKPDFSGCDRYADFKLAYYSWELKDLHSFISALREIRSISDSFGYDILSEEIQAYMDQSLLIDSDYSLRVKWLTLAMKVYK